MWKFLLPLLFTFSLFAQGDGRMPRGEESNPDTTRLYQEMELWTYKHSHYFFEENTYDLASSGPEGIFYYRLRFEELPVSSAAIGEYPLFIVTIDEEHLGYFVPLPKHRGAYIASSLKEIRAAESLKELDGTVWAYFSKTKGARAMVFTDIGIATLNEEGS